jgi:hypothetical protein
MARMQVIVGISNTNAFRRIKSWVRQPLFVYIHCLRTSQTFTACVSTTYSNSVNSNRGQKCIGNGTNPSHGAMPVDKIPGQPYRDLRQRGAARVDFVTRWQTLSRAISRSADAQSLRARA